MRRGEQGKMGVTAFAVTNDIDRSDAVLTISSASVVAIR